MKVYVINLDRSSDRMAYMRDLLAARGIEFERFPAIDGKSLDLPPGYPLPPAAVGCMQSHRAVWARAAVGSDRWTAVLEDDIHISERLAHFLREIGHSDFAADIVKFETNLAKSYFSRWRVALGPYRMRRIRSKTGGTAGYAIKRDAAAWLLEATKGFDLPIDLIFAPEVMPGLRAFHLVPSLVVQDQCIGGPLGSEIGMASDQTAARLAKRQRRRKLMQYLTGATRMIVPFDGPLPKAVQPR